MAAIKEKERFGQRSPRLFPLYFSCGEKEILHNPAFCWKEGYYNGSFS